MAPVTRPVTLSTGITVQVQLVDLSADSPLTLREALQSAYARVGAKHAGSAAKHLEHQLVIEAAAQQRTHKPRTEAPEPHEEQLAALRSLDAALLRRGCVRPTLDELLAAYGGDPSAPDLGLGSDYSTLVSAIRERSGLREPDDAELTLAGVFLREWAVTLDSMGKRYGRRPSDFAGFQPGAPERERLALDLGVYYWARGEDSLDEAWRKGQEQLQPG